MIEQSNSTRTALLLANIGGSSLCANRRRRSFGRDLSAQGEAAMVAFAVEWITKLFGSDAARAVTKSSATRWNDAALCARRDVGGCTGCTAVAKNSRPADRLHVSGGRSHARDAVGNRRWRLGQRRARGGGGTAQDRGIERHRASAGGAGSKAASSRGAGAACAADQLIQLSGSQTVENGQADDDGKRDQRITDRAEQFFAGAPPNSDAPNATAMA